MRVLKFLLKGLLALVLLAVAGAFIAQPTITTRLVGLAFGGDQGPREAVAGGQAPPIATAPEGQRSIPAPVLEQAIALGTRTESHALLIWQGGALQLEHYWPGHDATTTTPTQSMHKSVLALLIGIGWIIRGIADLVEGLAHPGMPARGWVIFIGVVSLLAGIVVLMWPAITLGALVWVAGLWLVVLGIIEVIGSFQLRGMARDLSA